LNLEVAYTCTNLITLALAVTEMIALQPLKFLMGHVTLTTWGSLKPSCLGLYCMPRLFKLDKLKLYTVTNLCFCCFNNSSLLILLYTSKAINNQDLIRVDKPQ